MQVTRRQGEEVVKSRLGTEVRRPQILLKKARDSVGSRPWIPDHSEQLLPP